MLVYCASQKSTIASVFSDEKIKTHLLDVNRDLGRHEAYFLKYHFNEKDLKVTDRELGQLADRLVDFHSKKTPSLESKNTWDDGFDWLSKYQSDAPSRMLVHKLVERTLLRQQAWGLLQSLIPLEKNPERRELLGKCCDVIMHTKKQSMYKEMFLQAPHLLLRQHNFDAFSSFREPGDATTLGRAFRKALNTQEYALVKNAHFPKATGQKGDVTYSDIRKFAASSREDKPGFFARKDNKDKIENIRQLVNVAYMKTMPRGYEGPKRPSGSRSG